MESFTNQPKLGNMTRRCRQCVPDHILCQWMWPRYEAILSTVKVWLPLTTMYTQPLLRSVLFTVPVLSLHQSQLPGRGENSLLRYIPHVLTTHDPAVMYTLDLFYWALNYNISLHIEQLLSTTTMCSTCFAIIILSTLHVLTTDLHGYNVQVLSRNQPPFISLLIT